MSGSGFNPGKGRARGGQSSRGKGSDLYHKSRVARRDPISADELENMEWPEGSGSEGSPPTGAANTTTDHALLMAVNTLTKQVDKLGSAVSDMQRQMRELRAETAAMKDMVYTTHNYVLELRALQTTAPNAAPASSVREGSCI